MTARRCPDCGHLTSVHFDAEGQPVTCRITGCACETHPAKDAAEVSTEARRICIDVPDGYMVSVSLVPYSGEEADGDDD